MSRQARPSTSSSSSTKLVPPDAALLAEIGRYDHVTRLPNRLQFIERFDTLAKPDRPKLLMLVTLAEARHYNEILRALGMAFAEEFVRCGASVLASLLPDDTDIFHVSVLSFATTIAVDDLTQAPTIATIIAAAFSDPILVDGIPIKTHVGVGLLAVDANLGAPESLRAALVAAQDSRRGDIGYSFYDHRSDAAHLRAFRLLADLPAALGATDQLALHYQPRIDLVTGRCHGAEALLRWTHPQLGPIAPSEFIALAEQTALITPLTDWVMTTAMQQNRAFQEAGHDLKISINASPVNLTEVGFDDLLLQRLQTYGLEPHHIELEFTEGTLASDSGRIIQQLTRLRSAGVTVALDDFGSGYSNLSYLARIPADVLKIDQSFVRPLIDAEHNDFVLRQIIAMARGLDFKICAEGIETLYAYDHLRNLGVDEGQGYHMARPLPAAMLGQWLEARP